MSEDSTLVLPGLDVSNPLSFFASLGILRTLDHHAKIRGELPPKLSFLQKNGVRPVLHGLSSFEELIDFLLADKETWARDEALHLAYDESVGWISLDEREPEQKLTRDLKPKPEAMRAFLETLASKLESNPENVGLRRVLDTAAAYGSEIVQDNNGNTKPTGFHFTAGSQRFLDAIVKLQENVAAADFEEALRGPWVRESRLPNMGWDATYVRSYALRAENPSGDQKTTIAAADWLAYIGLGAFPVFPHGAQLRTPGIFGGWKDSVFVWPIWSEPLTYRVAVSVLRSPVWAEIAREKREKKTELDTEGARRSEAAREQRISTLKARRVSSVFMTKISRSDQGGYGSFSPGELVG